MAAGAAAEELGALAMAATEVADMDIVAVGGERVPVNSRVLARRWGAYIETLEREGTAVQEGVDVATLRGGESGRRISGSTITGSGSGGRPRTLYMPHTVLTIQALVAYLYSGSLPRGCTPQVLCSLLHVARPYRVEGLLEAVVEATGGDGDRLVLCFAKEGIGSKLQAQTRSRHRRGIRRATSHRPSSSGLSNAAPTLFDKAHKRGTLYSIISS